METVQATQFRFVDPLRLSMPLQRLSNLPHLLGPQATGLGGELSLRPLNLPLLTIVDIMVMLLDPSTNLPFTMFMCLVNGSTKT